MIVDDEDYPYLTQWSWYAYPHGRTVYAARGIRKNGRHTTVTMHRDILKANPGQIVDHANRNGLDNRRSNLRFVTAQQSVWNRSKEQGTDCQYKGVYLLPLRAGDRWTAWIRRDGKTQYLGTFYTAEEGAKAYDTAARRLFGEFAVTNFPAMSTATRSE